MWPHKSMRLVFRYSYCFCFCIFWLVYIKPENYLNYTLATLLVLQFRKRLIIILLHCVRGFAVRAVQCEDENQFKSALLPIFFGAASSKNSHLSHRNDMATAFSSGLRGLDARTQKSYTILCEAMATIHRYPSLKRGNATPLRMPRVGIVLLKRKKEKKIRFTYVEL